MSKYNYRNIVPGHFRGVKNKSRRKQFKKNPGYDIIPSWALRQLWKFGIKRSIVPHGHKFDWYKPPKKKHNRKNKRGQTKPR